MHDSTLDGRENKVAVGIDLGGTNVSVALVDANGGIRRSTSRQTLPVRGPDPVMDDMSEMVEEVIIGLRISRDDVIGLGIGTPGPISHRDGLIIRAGNLPGWENVRLRRGLLERTGLPTVLDNDANAAAFAEFWVGAGRGRREIATLTLGTGIGSGFIHGGELLRGHFDNAAEMGHLIVQVGGRPCSCGQNGCLEAYASPGNMVKQAIEAIEGGRTSSLQAVLDSGERFGSRQIADAAQAGDALAAELWDRACMYLAVACVNVQHAYNPEVLVLTGGMVNAGDFLLDKVRHHYGQMRWKLLDDIPEITISRLGREAGVIGAAGLAWSARDGGAFG